MPEHVLLPTIDNGRTRIVLIRIDEITHIDFPQYDEPFADIYIRGWQNLSTLVISRRTLIRLLAMMQPTMGFFEGITYKELGKYLHEEAVAHGDDPNWKS